MKEDHSDIWSDLLSDDDHATMKRARFGRRVGLGRSTAVLVIDAQNYMTGAPSANLQKRAANIPDVYPSACGDKGRDAIERIAELLDAAREHGAPVIYTQMELRRDGKDIGAYGRKRDLLDTEGWMLENSVGAAIVDAVKPAETDVVLVKKKPSAFFGTHLLSLLIDQNVDSVVVVGGSTSNCVRATVVDAASYNLRACVPYDGVFDRFDISHRVALFDIDRQYGDVTSCAALINHFTSSPGGVR